MTADQMGLLLTALFIACLACVGVIVRLENGADHRAEAERIKAQLARVRPPQGAVKPAEPTYIVQPCLLERLFPGRRLLGDDKRPEYPEDADDA